MAESFDATTVVKAVSPTQVEGIKIGINWTSDRQVSSIDLLFDFLGADNAKIGEGRLQIGPGAIREAIEAVYSKLETVATVAGKKAGDVDWPVRPDAEVVWTNAKTAVGNGTGLNPVTAATFVATKSWGQWMLRKEWRKSAVVEA